MQRSMSGRPDTGWRKSRYSNPSGNCVDLASWPVDPAGPEAADAPAEEASGAP